MFKSSFRSVLAVSRTRAFSTAPVSARPPLSPWAAAAGITAGAAVAWYSLSSNRVRAESPRAFKGDNEWVELKLDSSEEVSHNVKRLVFDLPNSDDVSGLVIASALLFKFTRENGKNVLRPYTPVSDPDLKGKIEFVIKRYEKGLMSNHVHGLKQGDVLHVKGPLPKYKWSPNLHKEITLLGAGSGITPLYQIFHAIAKNPEDKTKVHLVYANVTEEDILLHKELDSIVKSKPDQFKVTYFLDKPPKYWTGETGFVSKEFLTKNIVKPSDENIKVFVCGPPPFHNALSGEKVSPTDQGELVGALKDLGFDKEQVYKF